MTARTTPPKQPTSFRLPDATEAELADLCKWRQQERTAIVVQAIALYWREEKRAREERGEG